LLLPSLGVLIVPFRRLTHSPTFGSLEMAVSGQAPHVTGFARREIAPLYRGKEKHIA
jgi:hypothetical protein